MASSLLYEFKLQECRKHRNSRHYFPFSSFLSKTGCLSPSSLLLFVAGPTLILSWNYLEVVYENFILPSCSRNTLFIGEETPTLVLARPIFPFCFRVSRVCRIVCFRLYLETILNGSVRCQRFGLHSGFKVSERQIPQILVCALFYLLFGMYTDHGAM